MMISPVKLVNWEKQMKLNKLIDDIVLTKDSLKRINQEYKETKELQSKTFNQMIKLKKHLKLIKTIHWNNPDIRTDSDFINLFILVAKNYHEIKKEYNQRCMVLKLYKKCIKNRQQEISIYTIKNNSE